MTDADDRRVRKAIQGVQFPADKETLVAYAQERDADPRTLRALRALPERDYGNGDEVARAVPQRPEQTSG
ncbi:MULTISPECIES: DUF2795 domain-containing protein [Prauserella salsuginis group]|uniref:DUF2795 domain-containing protein n=2 Tax=Prauserella salsuginis group TaxID=2893672 RepID=A0A839XL67_9PSEU|nr:MULTISPECIES: DUF2795 domain-containing protein [Prauserella salsuginis group]MBB3662274.1 hypothetical protein [Prauserella sediminis]MCR3719987.1 Protein of unknown function (DUF2795) [Prauserella flava]MCR3736469.1 Protein of unknown function (DUF2795) [Prauserella salsuginis]